MRHLFYRLIGLILTFILLSCDLIELPEENDDNDNSSDTTEAISANLLSTFEIEDKIAYDNPLFIKFLDDDTPIIAYNVASRFTTNPTEGFYVKSLNSSLQPDGNISIHKEQMFIVDILVNNEGTLSMLVGQVENNRVIEDSPNVLYFVKMDLQGNITVKEPLIGQDGMDAGKYWYGSSQQAKLKWDGTKYAVFSIIDKNWAETPGENDDHTGDLFMFIDENGITDQNSIDLWRSSHSALPKLDVTSTGETIAMTVGDAYPFGVQFRNYTTKNYKVVWPPDSMIITYAQVHSTTDAGGLGGIIAAGDKVFASLISPTKLPYESNERMLRKKRSLLLIFDTEGNKIKETYLSDKETGMYSSHITHYGNDRFLIAWWQGPEFDLSGDGYAAIVDSEGDITTPAFELGAQVRHTSFFFNFPNGDAGYADINYHTATINIYSIK